MNGLEERNWEELAAMAEDLKKVGMTRLYLHGRAGQSLPWSIASECEPGGSHRLDISTSVRFSALHKGITFVWSFDLEKQSANGKGYYEIDRDGLAQVFAKLPANMRLKFAEYLADCAEKIHAKGDEHQGYANRQFADANLLRVIVAAVKGGVE